MAARVFISYRRDTGSGYALLIYDRLRRRLPDIFRDQNSLAPGERFGDRLKEEISRCDALIVVVSPGWAAAFSSREQESEDDWVLAEIEAASEMGKQIFPVLTGGTSTAEFSRLAPGFASRPALQKVLALQAGELHEDNYQTFLDRLARLLWHWPPPLYWLSSLVLLAFAVLIALWARSATAWGRQWWMWLVVLSAAWLLPNVIALSGGVYPRLPASGWLRGLASSLSGVATAVVLAVIAIIPGTAWRSIAVERGDDGGAATYGLSHRETARTRVIQAGEIHYYTFPAWSWSAVGIDEIDAGRGYCVREIPRPLQPVTIAIPASLTATALYIRADEALTQTVKGAGIGLHVTPLFGARRGTTISANPYGTEPLQLKWNSCSPPTAVEVRWSGTQESLYDDIKQLGGSPRQIALTAAGVHDIVLSRPR
jgi:hypothetical protein